MEVLSAAAAFRSWPAVHAVSFFDLRSLFGGTRPPYADHSELLSGGLNEGPVECIVRASGTSSRASVAAFVDFGAPLAAVACCRDYRHRRRCVCCYRTRGCVVTEPGAAAA